MNTMIIHRINNILLLVTTIFYCTFAVKDGARDISVEIEDVKPHQIQGPVIKRLKRQLSVQERISRLEGQLAEFLRALNSGELKGEQGATGVPGADGVKGFPGLIGRDGPDGEKGERGSTGITGPAFQGPKGENGEFGSSGRDGLSGLKGPRGDDGNIGFPGIPGQKGEFGRQGRPGMQGRNGNDLDRNGPMVSSITKKIEDMTNQMKAYEQKLKERETKIARILNNA